MARFIAKRVGLALITLWMISVIVFVAAQILPGNVGRARLGPFADQRSVDVLNHQLGTDKPLLTQYWKWISGFVRGDFGHSLIFNSPARPIVTNAFEHSLKLAAVAFVIVVPLSILGGIVAALRYGKPTDRIITTLGQTGTVIPEFVSGIILIIVFGVWLNVLPISATPAPGAGPIDQIYHLILPAMPLGLVLFGYIARMARAGTIASLDADYTRTAYLKGLARSVVVRRHVLRNALLPTITVIASQATYLIGGLVVIEFLFNYQGIGLLIFTSANQKDFPLLESGVLTVAIVAMLASLLADIAYSLLNPRIRHASAE